VAGTDPSTLSDGKPALRTTECWHALQESLAAHSSHSDSPFQVGGLSSRCVKSFSGQVEQLWHQCQMTLLPAWRKGTLTSITFAHMSAC
jgi:hypothetical protein